MERKQQLLEEFFFFESGGFKLFGAMDSNVEKNRGAIVICSPFGEEKVRTYRMLRNFARLLAESGYTVLRFDYMGEGDSDGKFEEASVERRLTNIHDAISLLRKETGIGDISLLGLRFGGALAMLGGSRYGKARNLILWEPVVDSKNYFYDLLRANLASQTRESRRIIFTREQLIEKMRIGERVEVDGYPWAWEFYKEAAAIDLYGVAGTQATNTLIIQISEAKNVREEFVHLHDVLKNGNGKHSLLSVRKEFFWENLKVYNPHPETLFRTTLEWLTDVERSAGI